MLTVEDAARTRRFLREVLALPYVLAADGHPVFTHAPSTAGVHPAMAEDRGSSLSLTCDQLGETVAELVCGDATITAVSSTPTPSVTLSLPRFDDTVTLHPRRG